MNYSWRQLSSVKAASFFRIPSIEGCSKSNDLLSKCPQVLRGLTFEAQPGDKVGIVGRTGAGKTSLFGALLRLTELDEGKVFIDGIDVARIGLTDLRSSVAVIPQDPVLFQVRLCFV